MVPVLQGAQLWVRYVNDGGGVNGHRIKLLVYDDGGDPARHRAQVQEAAERQHVIAFLTNGETITGRGSVEYINANRIPILGLIGGEPWAFSSPMYFPQMSNADGLAGTFVPSTAEQVIPKGKTKLGTLWCVEAESCDTYEGTMADQAKAYGFQHVYRARASITQPDYTAECLAARNQGVEVFFVGLEQNAVGRVTTACLRQGYRPIIGIHGLGVVDSMKSNPNYDGLVTAGTVFPYFQSGTPATDEFQKALGSYGKGLILGSGTAVGWASGKLFERAAMKLPEPPTREAVLAGLWSMKNDTLGGLTMPLTFVENQPTKPVSCWFNLTISKGAWISPDNYRLHCT